MANKDTVIKSIENCLHEKECDDCSYEGCIHAHGNCIGDLMAHALELLKEQPQVVRCKDCRHWDKTTREEGNDCILGQWEDAVCDVFRDWDSYGDLGEHFRRTNGDWFCADGERR